MKTEKTNRLFLFTLATAILLVSFTPLTSYALDYYWIGGSGSWSDPSNWNPNGVPGTGPGVDVDNAYLVSSDSINRNVEISSDVFFLDHMTLDSTGTGTMTLAITSGGLQSHPLGDPTYIGANGIGIVNQSGGYLAVWTGNFMVLGVNSGSTGIYNLSGGSMGYDVRVGYEGNGIFNQTGGDFICDWLAVGYGGTGSGTYNLINGNILPYLGAPFRVGPNGTFNQKGGTFTEAGGSIDIGGVYNMSGGSLTIATALGGITNRGTFNYSGGNIQQRYPYDNYVGIHNEGIFNSSGTGTRTIEANIVNDGTSKVTHTTAVYNGTFTNNGAYISDPATQYFNDLIVGKNGYLVGQYNDYFYINGNFINNSTMNTDWNTMHSNLSFITGLDNLHDLYLTGIDYGALMSGYSDNFSWGELDITGNIIYLYDGNDIVGGALYLRKILGLDISGNLITNIYGIDGLNIYYLANLPSNWYLHGLEYGLEGGGHLIPIKGVPEPSTMLLLGSGLLRLVALRKKVKK
jgi:hypothetical protein